MKDSWVVSQNVLFSAPAVRGKSPAAAWTVAGGKVVCLASFAGNQYLGVALTISCAALLNRAPTMTSGGYWYAFIKSIQARGKRHLFAATRLTKNSANPTKLVRPAPIWVGETGNPW